MARSEELFDWWMSTSLEEAEQVIPKAIEYGSADLAIMGEALLLLLPHLKGVVSGEELAVGFYALGKVARLFGSWEAGRAGSVDSWHDLRVYAKMAMRIREEGSWG